MRSIAWLLLVAGGLPATLFAAECVTLTDFRLVPLGETEYQVRITWQHSGEEECDTHYIMLPAPAKEHAQLNNHTQPWKTLQGRRNLIQGAWFADEGFTFNGILDLVGSEEGVNCFEYAYRTDNATRQLECRLHSDPDTINNIRTLVLSVSYSGGILPCLTLLESPDPPRVFTRLPSEGLHRACAP